MTLQTAPDNFTNLRYSDTNVDFISISTDKSTQDSEHPKEYSKFTSYYNQDSISISSKFNSYKVKSKTNLNHYLRIVYTNAVHAVLIKEMTY